MTAASEVRMCRNKNPHPSHDRVVGEDRSIGEDGWIAHCPGLDEPKRRSMIDEIDADPVSRRELDKARGWLIGKAEAARDLRAARDHFQRTTGATDTDILVRVYNDAIRVVEEGWEE